MATLDRDRLLRDYAPRLAQRADSGSPGGTIDDPSLLGDLLDRDVVSEPVETEETGVMVALVVPPAAAEQLALNTDDDEIGDIDVEDPDELHLTLAYLGTAGIDLTTDSLELLASTVTAWAAGISSIEGVISGIGVFNNEDTVVTYASFDSPALPTAHQTLVTALDMAGLKVFSNHGFTPHITLAYGDARGATVPRLPITFDAVTIAYAGLQMDIPFGATNQPPADATPDESAVTVPLGKDIPPEDNPDGDDADPKGQGDNDSTIVDGKLPRPQFYASDRTFAHTWSGPNTTGGNTTITTNVLWKPLVTTSGARTVITGPATTERAAMWGKAPNPNPHMLWMQGRFVGAERPNRNGAYWATSDLEVGGSTVAHGPLNWLHQERHVIGTIADAKFIPSGDSMLVSQGPGQAAAQRAADTTDPHITALSAIWSWLYPQEASVVQMASDAGVLAYSMECISQSIQCVGDNGCGQTYSYMDVAAAGGGCTHLQQRSSVRRLVNPTFLGGAVIVPPTRPGWADADATVMAEVAKVAEKAYDDAGRPDIPANTWEQLMAGVLTYTQASQ